jgi:hypothetical protein
MYDEGVKDDRDQRMKQEKFLLKLVIFESKRVENQPGNAQDAQVDGITVIDNMSGQGTTTGR